MRDGSSMTSRPDPGSILVIADFACPFSFVMESLLGREVEGSRRITHRAFELFPYPAPLPPAPAPVPDALARLANEAGITLGVPVAAVRTGKAHEAAAFAEERGDPGALRSAIYRAYWTEGRDIGRIDVLCDLGLAAGLDGDDLRVHLDIETHAARVRDERDEAWSQGVRQTPTIVFGPPASAPFLIGAHPPAEIRAMMRAAFGTG
jgi:predicted DsbA family dithiol-disulfide isomerase